MSVVFGLSRFGVLLRGGEGESARERDGALFEAD